VPGIGFLHSIYSEATDCVNTFFFDFHKHLNFKFYAYNCIKKARSLPIIACPIIPKVDIVNKQLPGLNVAMINRIPSNCLNAGN